MRFPIRVKNFSNPESFEKSLEQNAGKTKLTPDQEREMCRLAGQIWQGIGVKNASVPEELDKR
jgi:hypothetical protein